ncbi:MAG: hypothetical protein LBG47_08415 [Prevotellaceae bacterium]|nr:hypothetical protein [Prevotellaceae bacterium]
MARGAIPMNCRRVRVHVHPCCGPSECRRGGGATQSPAQPTARRYRYRTEKMTGATAAARAPAARAPAKMAGGSGYGGRRNPASHKA